MEILWGLGGAILGFIAGFLVYRHNAKKFTAREAELLSEITSLRKVAEDKVTQMKEALKEKL